MKTFNSKKDQGGAILIVALVMLLLLTIIGLSSIRGTTMQERMAGNARDESLAFQASETAMRQAESVIRAQTRNYWQNYTAAPAWASATALTDQGTPRYKITPLPGISIVKPGDSLQAGAPVSSSIIRIEAEGLGTAKDDASNWSSKVELRSIYRR